MISPVEDILAETYKRINVSSLTKLIKNIYNSRIRPADSPLPAITMDASNLPDFGQQGFSNVFLVRIYIHAKNHGGETMKNAFLARIKKEISNRMTGRVPATKFTGDLFFEKNTIEDVGHVINEQNPAESMHILQYRVTAYAST